MRACARACVCAAFGRAEGCDRRGDSAVEQACPRGCAGIGGTAKQRRPAAGGRSQRGERGGSARSRGAAGLVTDQAQREAGGLQDTWLQRRALPRRPPEPGSGFSPQGPRGRSAAAASSSTLPATSRGSSVSEQPRVPGCVSAPGTRAGRRSQAGGAGRGRRPAAARRGPRDSAL